jgi:two-component system alkaline phosphatase synthesis response regulator PhoP
MWKLLVIDNEVERTEQIADWFGSIEYDVIRAHSGQEGIEKAKESQPDVILLDILMPEMDGHAVLLRLKRDPDTAGIPVVICSTRADSLDGLEDLLRLGLKEGADYVVARKWGLATLEEVVNKVLPAPEQPNLIRVGAHELRLAEGCAEVWVDGQGKTMTRREAAVLAYMNSRRGQACRVEEILDSVYEGVGDPYSVYKLVDRIRKKVEPDAANPIFVENVRGFGYKLVEGD